MTSETTYAELSFKNESKSSSTKSWPPAAPKEKTSPHKSNPSFPKLLFASLLVLLLLLAISFFIAFISKYQKYSQLLEKKTTKELTHTELECMKENLTMEEKDWSCCPKAWKSFSSNCYFISTITRNWTESERDCSEMKAHLLVINTKDEQVLSFFFFKDFIYMTQYWVINNLIHFFPFRFWHSGEPSNLDEGYVKLHFRYLSRKWGWNDVPCNGHHKSICKVMKIYL
ncbi:C-type lectin domain family 4 member A-like [Phoca vitulina]|uniref:C-type lectin domain family 4 member A-like n=1 Tax=Phoca vitulina TaxID=9720 RepID=UPI0013961C41|nr:C-type lectin domain family 4 member A-like [Phoca vitulina]